MDSREIYRDYCEDVNPDYKYFFFDIFDPAQYIDPDKASSGLYDAIYKLFFYDYRKMINNGIKCVNLVGQKRKDGLFYSFFLYDKLNEKGYPDTNKEPDFILSADCLGPSKFQSMNIAGLSIDEVKSNIENSRTLGGHIIWPRGDTLHYKINEVRGGCIKKKCDYGFYDRTDWTFLLLKQYYEVINDNNQRERLKKYIAGINVFFPEQEISVQDWECFEVLFKAFDVSRSWFLKFKSFIVFSDFFKIKGSFVDDLYNVVELTSYFPIKPDKEGYLKYIENNLNAITVRNSNI